MKYEDMTKEQLINELSALRQRNTDPVKEEKSFFEAVLYNIEDGVVACNADGILTFFNRAAREFHGLPEKQITADEWANYYDLYLPDGKTKMTKEQVPLFRALQGETVKNLGMVIAPRQGKKRTLLASGQPLFDSNGKKIGAVVSMHDITDRKLAEDELKEYSNKLENLVGHQTAELNERVKELNCLYGIASLVEQAGNSLQKILQGTAEMIPLSWQYPEITCARILLEGQEFKTANFNKSSRRLMSPIIVNSQEIGAVEVYYLQEKPDLAEGPFLKEERKLINAIAERLGKIFDRIQAHNHLKQQGYYLEKIQELGQIGMWEFDLVQNRLIWTDENFRIFGVPERSIVNYEIFLEKVHPEDREYVDREWNAALEGKPYDIEHRIIVDGKTKWFREKVEINFDSGGKAVNAIGFTQDITKRREAENNYEMLFLEMPEAFALHEIICNVEGTPVDYRFLDVNKSFECMTGFKAEAIRGKTVMEIMPKTESIWIEKFGRVALTGEPVFFENYSVELDKFFEVTAFQPTPNQFVSIFIDITERKLVNEESRRLTVAIEQADEMIVITDLAGIIEYVNPAFEHITGYSRSEAIGQSTSLLKSGNQTDAFYQELWALISDGETWRGYFLNKKKDGCLYDEEATITPVKNTEGVVINYVAVKRDVSKEKIIEEQLRQSQKMESIGTIAGGIAHDFNNILGVIMGCTELSLDEVKDRPEIVQSLEQVLGATFRAKDLVAQILTFSRVNDIEKKVVKIIPLVKEVCKFLRSSLPTTIEIRQNFTTDHDLVMANPTQLHQVLMNLCTNAGHAMAEKGGLFEVSLEKFFIGEEDLTMFPSLRIGQYLRLTVKDTGAGIKHANLGRIFEPYFTTKKTGEGTGLGLAVVHGIIKDHKGDVKVFSEVGKGTIFSVLLPLMEENAELASRKKLKPLMTGAETILLVDDEEALLKTDKIILERLGYTVVKASNGADALETFLLAKDSYDLVITDKTMPKMTGIELAIEIKKIRPDIPILLCTGFLEKGDEEKGENAGINKIISKPINRQKISEIIRSILDNKEA